MLIPYVLFSSGSEMPTILQIPSSMVTLATHQVQQHCQESSKPCAGLLVPQLPSKRKEQTTEKIKHSYGFYVCHVER